MLKVSSAYWAGLLIWRAARRVEDVMVLVVDVKSNDGYHLGKPPATKFPGGDEEVEDSDELDTAIREILEETGLTVSRQAVLSEICRVLVSDNHYRVWYPVMFDDCGGELRPVPSAGRKTTVSAPYWIRVGDLRSKLYTSHQPALRKFEETLRDFYRIAS